MSGESSEAPTSPILVEETTRPAPTMLSDEEVLSRLRALDRIGRFIFVRPLGEGGMGIVTLAYDEELDRKVALKMIRQGYCDQPEHRRRLLREAQSLARLSHPNVVTLYEVGEHQGRPYLAMEYVEGTDLRRWLREAPRSRREILRAFVDAGRGLAAAHAVGLVHRDFKPANVLVGLDGRARVLDFGLSRAAVQGGPAADAVTVAGAIIGTPAYMSPEQLMGQPLDARSDQYSFAVALYEALVGARPFTGRSLADRLREGFEAPPAGAALPRRLARALARALAPVPAQRFPSMDALLDALTRSPWRRWRWLAYGVALSGAAFGLGLYLARPEPCAGAAEQLAGAWDQDSRDAALTALGDGGSADLLVERVDVYARAWTEARRDVCLEHQRGESSASALDRRIACLDAARVRLAALAGALRERGPEFLEAALVAVGELPASEMCRRQGFAATPPPPPDAASEVAALREQLARAALAYRPSDAQAARAGVRAIVERAGALAYRPLAAEALALLGRLEVELAEYEAAARDLEAALWTTLTFDAPDQTAEVMGNLLQVLGRHLDRADRVAGWRPHADALMERLGPDSEGTASIAQGLSAAAMRHDRIDEAITLAQRALAIMEARHGRDHLRTARFLNNYAAALGNARRYAESRPYLERALAVLERAYGPDHGEVLTVLGNLGRILHELGDDAAALQTIEDGLARALRARGADHPDVATMRTRRGMLRRARHELPGARDDYLAAHAILRVRRGVHHDTYRNLLTLVQVELELGLHPAAREHAAELIEVALPLFGDDAPELFDAFAEAVDVEVAADQPAATLALAERALDRPLARGLRDKPDIVAYLRFHVARSLRRLGRDRPRADELAASALPALAADPDNYAEELAELAAWRAPPRGRRRSR